MLLLAVAAEVAHPRPAHALFRKKKKKKKPEHSIDEYSDRLVTLFWPIAQNLGFSGAIGFGTALALKVRCALTSRCCASARAWLCRSCCWGNARPPRKAAWQARERLLHARRRWAGRWQSSAAPSSSSSRSASPCACTLTTIA